MADVFAVIPARGGSKRIPRKNLRTVGDRTLLGHAIAAAQSAERVDDVVVSTDDPEIESHAEDCGAAVPFRRPEALAGDDVQLPAVMAHAIEWYTENRGVPDVVCALLPTTPLRTGADVDDAVERLQTSDATAVLTVSPFETPPVWAVAEDEGGFLREYFEGGYLWTDGSIARSQDVPDLRHPNGAVFGSYLESWNRYETFYQPKTVGAEMPRERSIDIDEFRDLHLARALLAADVAKQDAADDATMSKNERSTDR